MNSRINHKNIVTKKNRLSNLFYVRQAVASATFFIMSKQINPYLDFVLGLDATQFDLLCDSINQRKDRERYGATSFEEAALNYGRKPICPKCLSDKYHEDGYTPSLAKRY